MMVGSFRRRTDTGAYLIIDNEVRDKMAFEEYQKSVPALVDGHKGEVRSEADLARAALVEPD